MTSDGAAESVYVNRPCEALPTQSTPLSVISTVASVAMGIVQCGGGGGDLPEDNLNPAVDVGLFRQSSVTRLVSNSQVVRKVKRRRLEPLEPRWSRGAAGFGGGPAWERYHQG